MRTIELFHTIKIGGGNRAVETEASRASNRRTNSRENHVTTADLLDCRPNFGPHLLIQPGVMHLWHLLGRFQAASECLIHEFHGKVLSWLETNKGTIRAHFRARSRLRNQRN